MKIHQRTPKGRLGKLLVERELKQSTIEEVTGVSITYADPREDPALTLSEMAVLEGKQERKSEDVKPVTWLAVDTAEVRLVLSFAEIERLYHAATRKSELEARRWFNQRIKGA